MNITLTEVKNPLQAYARSKGRPEYTHYAVKAVHFAIANGLDHPLKSLVSVSPKSITAQASELKKTILFSDDAERLARNRIAAAETIELGENTFIGECKHHGFVKFTVYRKAGYVCNKCKRELKA